MRFLKLALLGSIFALNGCNPALNWREVRVGADASLKALLPCKPEQASRPITLAGHGTDLHLQGCEAQGMLFAVSWVNLAAPVDVQAAQAQWQAGMVASLRAGSVQTSAFTIGGASPTPALRVIASGAKPDGQPVQAQGVWLVRGRQVFHAAMYGPTLAPEAVEAFFSGIEISP